MVVWSSLAEPAAAGAAGAASQEEEDEDEEFAAQLPSADEVWEYLRANDADSIAALELAFEVVKARLEQIESKDLHIIADEIGTPDITTRQRATTIRNKIATHLSASVYKCDLNQLPDPQSAEALDDALHSLSRTWEMFTHALDFVTGNDLENDSSVEGLLDCRVEGNTAKRYGRRNDEFKVWIRSEEAIARLEGRTDVADRLRSYLKPSPGAHADADPFEHEGAARRAKLHLTEEFDVYDWLRFINTRTVGKGDKAMLKGIGTLSTFRSAFNHEWVEAVTKHGQKRPENMRETIQVAFTSLAKQDANDRLNGKRKQKVGKDALPFRAYVVIAKHLLRRGDKKSVFAHTFLTLSWNLMCRLNNTASLRAHHFRWDDDCFAVLFSQTKMDKKGEAADGAKHCFSNPLDLDIDLLLSLAIYFSVYHDVGVAGAHVGEEGHTDEEATYASVPIFPGGKSSQQKRFTDILAEVMEDPQVKCALEAMGVGDRADCVHNVEGQCKVPPPERRVPAVSAFAGGIPLVLSREETPGERAPNGQAEVGVQRSVLGLHSIAFDQRVLTLVKHRWDQVEAGSNSSGLGQLLRAPFRRAPVCTKRGR
eukprot:m.384906 g.384906  ORF g.384906 m.384906 type:complete len:595 (+) comp16736_c0_seq9:249-2033(+)